jgi:hypothetical protein
MMARAHFKPFVLPFAAASLFFATAMCAGGGASSKQYRQYDPLPFTDTFRFDASRDRVYRALIEVVQERGGVVTLSDPAT